MTHVTQNQLLTTRGFEKNDLCRLVAWAGLRTPDFLDGRAGVESARAFLEHGHKGYRAVCYRGDEACKRAGKYFAGPLAVLQVAFNQRACCVYIDPDLAGDAALAHDIEGLIDAHDALCGPRLAAA